MSPRAMGVRERRDKTFYDTTLIEPEGDVRLFSVKKRIGNELLTNLLYCGKLSADNTYVALAIGARLIGKEREEEDQFLDHLRFSFWVGDHLMHDIMGPQISMLRHVFTKEEADRMAELLTEPNEVPPSFRVGYHFIRPIIVPVRQSVSVRVQAAPELPETVRIRVHLFGVLSRDVP